MKPLWDAVFPAGGGGVVVQVTHAQCVCVRGQWQAVRGWGCGMQSVYWRVCVLQMVECVLAGSRGGQAACRAMVVQVLCCQQSVTARRCRQAEAGSHFCALGRVGGTTQLLYGMLRHCCICGQLCTCVTPRDAPARWAASLAHQWETIAEL
jgi:hypothetical protein